MANAFLQPHPVLLLVDDDPRIRELTEYAAKSSGEFPTVLTAEDGQGALSVLRQSGIGDPPLVPDIILTDLSMPRLNGFELIDCLKHDPVYRDLPIVMFSSSYLPYDREKALDMGCRAFFEKPTTLADLKAMMHSIGSLLKPA